MKTNPSNYEENLKKVTGKLLQELSAIDEFAKSVDFQLENAEAEQIRRQEFDSIDELAWTKKDGSVDIRAAGDAMTCFANFHPPSPDGELLTADLVQRAFSDLGVVNGIDWEAIGEAIFSCNTEGRDIVDLVVARGIPAVEEEPAHYELHERFLTKAPVAEDGQKNVDYRSRTPFILVKKGDILAVRIPTKTGSEGIDVRGNKLPYSRKTLPDIKGTRNTEIVEDGIAASVDGMAKVQGSEVWVEEVLHIDANVDYHTGHVDFPGNVIIEGFVADDFHVYSGGSLFCNKTLNATDVRAKGDLSVKGGIIGRGNALISVAGEVRVKFLERCNLEAGRDVYSEIGSINSVIQTLGKFSSSASKGIVIGGKIYAQNGIEVFNIGTPSSPKSEIICGINYQVLRKLEWIKNKNLDLALRLREVKRTLDHASKAMPDLFELKNSLLAGIHKLNEAARILVNQLTKNEDSRVVVYGSLIPGTYVEICNVSFIANQLLKRVFLYLNKEKGRIEVAQIRTR